MVIPLSCSPFGVQLSSIIDHGFLFLVERFKAWDLHFSGLQTGQRTTGTPMNLVMFRVSTAVSPATPGRLANSDSALVFLVLCLKPDWISS